MERFKTTKAVISNCEFRERSMSKSLGPCPDCGTPIGERHRAGCPALLRSGGSRANISRLRDHPESPANPTSTKKSPNLPEVSAVGISRHLQTVPGFVRKSRALFGCGPLLPSWQRGCALAYPIETVATAGREMPIWQGFPSSEGQRKVSRYEAFGRRCWRCESANMLLAESPCRMQT
jgi:hypothetical protein